MLPVNIQPETTFETTKQRLTRYAKHIPAILGTIGGIYVVYQLLFARSCCIENDDNLNSTPVSMLTSTTKFDADGIVNCLG